MGHHALPSHGTGQQTVGSPTLPSEVEGDADARQDLVGNKIITGISSQTRESAEDTQATINEVSKTGGTAVAAPARFGFDIAWEGSGFASREKAFSVLGKLAEGLAAHLSQLDLGCEHCCLTIGFSISDEEVSGWCGHVSKNTGAGLSENTILCELEKLAGRASFALNLDPDP